MTKGWYQESAKHAMARKGIATGRKTHIKAIPKPVYKQPPSWIEGTRFKINDKITVIARYGKARDGFNHIADLYVNGFLVDSAKMHYINRSWESYEFQEAMKKLINKTPELSEEEKKQGIAFADKSHYDPKEFNTIAMVAKMGDIFGQTQKEKNDWKTRMLKAGLENKGLEMPEDWDTLDEETKKRRLDLVIGELSKKKVED